jgi:uncharacterized membrane protein YphA (DoxX/SURF4 family)
MSGLDSQTIAWLILRGVFGLFYLYTAYTLIKGFSWTVEHTQILFGKNARLFAFGAICLMIGGGASILLGFYGRIGAALLILFTAPGTVIHFKEIALANNLRDKLKTVVPPDSQQTLNELGLSAYSGHFSTALKNIVLVATAVFILLMGTGPFSWKP